MKNRLTYIWLVCAVLCGGLFSCSDDDATLKDALKAPSTTLDSKSYNSLKFSWDKVADAIQYGYVLKGPNEKVIGEGTTVYTNASFSGLLPNTEYTLNVWAFPSLQSDYSTSPAFVLTSTTDPLKVLDTPVLTVSSESAVTITWNAVQNADYYVYVITDEEGNVVDSSDSYTSTSITLRGLSLGTYTVSLFAMTDKGGYVPQSQEATITFDVVPQPVWDTTGTYYSYKLGTSWQATMTYYNDGSYKISNWYNAEGSELSFYYYDSSDMYSCYFDILNGTYDSSTYLFTVDTKNAACPSLYITPWYSYSGLYGDQVSGSVWLGIVEAGNYYPADNNCYDWFIWDNAASVLSVDDICGTYNLAIDDNWFYYDTTNWAWSAAQDGFDWETTITKVDDTHVEISHIYWDGVPVIAEFDGLAKTLTIPLDLTKPYGGYTGYYLASEYDAEGESTGAPSAPIVMTINDDMSIRMNNFDFWMYCADFWGANYDYYYSLLYNYSGTFSPVEAN